MGRVARKEPETRRRQSSAVLGIAACAIAGVLAVFAFELGDTQSKQRRDVETRFHERAQVTAALTHSIFASVSSGASEATAVKTYGRPTVSSATMAAGQRQGGFSYLALLDQNGSVIAASPGLPAPARARLASRRADVQHALTGAPFSLSNVLAVGPGGTRVLELAQALSTGGGLRVLVSGIGPQSIGAFIGSYLARIPSSSTSDRAFVLDSAGNVVGTADPSQQVGQPVREPGLIAAIRHRPQGSLEQDRYFVTAPVADSPWHVVLTAASGELFASVSGPRKWVPWVIFAAFALAAAAILVLLRRVLRGAAKLADANTCWPGPTTSWR